MVKANSILIIRLSAIGDVVMASPLINCLREKYPDSKLTWLVQPELAELLSENKNLDLVLTWPKKLWLKLLKEGHWLTLLQQIKQFRQMLKSHNFDLAIDLQGLLKSGLIAFFSGAKYRIGLGSKEGSQFLMSECVVKPQNDPKISSEYLHLAKQLNCNIDQFNMSIRLSEKDIIFTNNFIEQHKITQGYIAIAPFTTRDQKHWFNEKWSGLVGKIFSIYQFPLVILGGNGDLEASDSLMQTIKDKAVNLVGQTTLRQAASVISQAKLLIGVDTGLTHFGIAVNTSTIALFGSTCPYLETGRSNTRVIYNALPCSPCRRKPTCNNEYTCMQNITVEQVFKASQELLA